MPSNTAAWIPGRNRPLETGPAPYPSPRPDQIVIRNRAVAVNPLDWVIQTAGQIAYRWLTYPTVLGSDTAGDVVEVGSAVTRFRPGDRVLAHAVGTDKDSNSAAEGTFQLYTVVLERMASPIPDDLAYPDAAVLPLALSTAACGMFQSDYLGLQHPARDAAPTGQTVLVWGGSTSVGSNAIQLAAAAGYDVVTTASPQNFEYARALGATQVFDYRSPTVTTDILAALKDRTLAGAVAIGPGSAAACIRIAGRSQGNRFVAMFTAPVTFEKGFSLPRTVFGMAGGMIGLQVAARRRGVRIKFVIGTTLKHNDVCTAIYREFLPDALAECRYQAVPKPSIVGHGLTDVQSAMDRQRHGVSASKVVITLD